MNNVISGSSENIFEINKNYFKSTFCVRFLISLVTSRVLSGILKNKHLEGDSRPRPFSSRHYDGVYLAIISDFAGQKILINLVYF